MVKLTFSAISKISQDAVNLLLNTSIISFIHHPGSAQYLKGILRYWSPSLYEHKLQMDSNTLIRYFPNSSLKLLQTYLRLC